MLYSFRTLEDNDIIIGKIEAKSEKEAFDKVKQKQFSKENIIKREPKDPKMLDMIGVWLE